MLINCIWMKVKGVLSQRGPGLTLAYLPQLPSVISSITFKQKEMLMCSVAACCFHMGLFPFLRSDVHPWIIKKAF